MSRRSRMLAFAHEQRATARLARRMSDRPIRVGNTHELPAAAEQTAIGAWEQACAASHAGACGRLMEVGQSDPERADAYAARACTLGYSHACTLLASQEMLEAIRTESPEAARRHGSRMTKA
jgi:hypothetical protein